MASSRSTSASASGSAARSADSAAAAAASSSQARAAAKPARPASRSKGSTTSLLKKTRRRSLRPGEDGQQPAPALSERTAKLAAVLATRLSYASLKVSHGWIQQNIHEVENLYSSRFRAQAEQRAANRSRALRGTAAAARPPAAAGHGSEPAFLPGRNARGHQPYKSSSTSSSSSYRHHYAGHLVVPLYDQVATMAEMPTAEFGQTAYYPPRPLAGPFSVNDDGLHAGEVSYHHYRTQPSHPPLEQQQRPYGGDEPYAMSVQEPSPRRMASPPLPPPSPSMYNYLVSPLAPSRSTMSPARHGTPSRSPSFSAPSGKEGEPVKIYDDFWKTASSDGSIPTTTTTTQARRLSATTSLLAVDEQQHQHRPLHLGTPGVSSIPLPPTHLQPSPLLTSGGAGEGAIASTSFSSQQHRHSHHHHRPQPLNLAGPPASPAAGLASPFPPSFHSRQASLQSIDGFLPRSAGSGPPPSPFRRHQQTNSQVLRGEYSASNVTMDDLDSHFA